LCQKIGRSRRRAAAPARTHKITNFTIAFNILSGHSVLCSYAECGMFTRLMHLVDGSMPCARGAQYPAEHNVGHFVERKPALIE
jgi:hypothetical protein